MNTRTSSILGWAVAAGALSLFFASGFQAAQQKTGVVDMSRVIADSRLGKQNQETLRAMLQSRQNLLDFLDINRVATVEQANRLRALELKEGPQTPAEKQEADRIKADIQAAGKSFNDLNQKTNATDQDRLQLSEYNQRVRNTTQLLQSLQQELTMEISRKQGDLRREEIERAKAALKVIAEKGGYTIVLENQVAPYGVNDLTAEAIKELDK
ncbi:MAG: OmpH family outer membrane protein [Fimbriimonadaceae bacterium]|nr:OmpH family outer membrane protein [Fimbriimonadaceae bacterium]